MQTKEHDRLVFGRNVARLRTRKGWSQARLSGEAGIYLRHYQRIEGGYTNVSLDVILRIQRALRCSWVELTRGL